MIKNTILTALLATTALCTSSDYPSFDVFHSHCGLTVLFEDTLCVDIFNGLVSTLDNFIAGQDPTKGTYQYKERQPISYIWTIHKLADGNLDDVIFETN